MSQEIKFVALNGKMPMTSTTSACAYDPTALKGSDMTIDERIRNARKHAGLSQQQAADAAGMTQQQWSRYERGERSPDVETLRRMAEALGGRLVVRIVDEADADVLITTPKERPKGQQAAVRGFDSRQEKR